MTKETAIKLFEEKQVRSIWDDKQEKWYISIVDVIALLTESSDANAYWRKLKQRLKEEGNETVTNCHGLKMLAADGKMRMTDVADVEQLFRLIQSIPSPKAEPFKVWLAQVGSERLDEMQDPELSIDRGLEQYLKLGYSENWINQRLKSIEIRKELTDEWKKRGLKEGVQFATLTDIITKAWSEKTTKEYKVLKGLKKENLRENMTNTELILNMLAEASTKDISAATNPKDFEENNVSSEQEDELRELSINVKRQEKEIKKLKERIEEFEQDQAKSLARLESKNQEIERLNDEKSTLEQRIRNLEKEIRETASASGDPLAIGGGNFNVVREELQNRCQELQHVRVTLNHCKFENSELKEELRMSRERNDKFEIDYSKAISSIETLKKAIKQNSYLMTLRDREIGKLKEKLSASVPQVADTPAPPTLDTTIKVERDPVPPPSRTPARPSSGSQRPFPARRLRAGRSRRKSDRRGPDAAA